MKRETVRGLIPAVDGFFKVYLSLENGKIVETIRTPVIAWAVETMWDEALEASSFVDPVVPFSDFEMPWVLLCPDGRVHYFDDENEYESLETFMREFNKDD